jgi:cytochrome P450
MDLLTAPGPGRVRLDDIELFDSARYDSAEPYGAPHAAWRTLRAEAPLWPSRTADGVRIWSLTKFADVAAVLKDTRRYSSEYGTILDVRHGDPAGGMTINLMDPPRHRAVRVPATRSLASKALRSFAGEIERNVERMVAPLCEPGVHDAAEAFLPLAMAAMGPVLGVPRELWTTISRAAMAGVAPADPVYQAGDVRETLHSAHVELFTFLRGVIAERRRRPGSDLVSLLLEAELDGRRLSADEVLLNCYSFLMGANTTTPHVASQLLVAMAARPEVFKEISTGEASPASAVEEALRWATPTNHLTRRTTEEVVIRGTRIPAGELVCAWVASANRDEDVFARPYDFLPGRRPNPHIAYGTGVHVCVGALGARLVLRLALTRLLDRVTSVELAGPVRHLRSNFINGITALPLDVRG